MASYKSIELGKINEIVNFDNGKVFLHDKLELTSCEISINCVAKGFKLPFHHKHIENEEIYIFLKGEGLFTVDEEELKIREGSVIKVSPESSRTLENTGNEELQFICVQAKQDSLKQFGMKDGIIC